MINVPFKKYLMREAGKGVNKKGDKKWLKGEGVQSKVNVTGSIFLTLISPAIQFFLLPYP